MLGRRQWYIMSRGEEQALRCSVVCVGEGRSGGLSAGPPGQVLKELRDARLLLVRIPPSCFPDVLHYGRHWGLSRWRLVQFPPLRDRAASDQGPGHSTVLTGSSLHGGPQCTEPSNTACTAASAAHCTTPTCHSGTLRIVRMALLTEPVPRSVRQV